MRFHYHFMWLALLMGCDLYIGDDAPASDAYEVDGVGALPPRQPPDMPCLGGCDAGIEEDAPPNDAGCGANDAVVDAELATHPPLPTPQACIPICLDAGPTP